MSASQIEIRKEIIIRRGDGTITARIPGVWCQLAGRYVTIPEKPATKRSTGNDEA